MVNDGDSLTILFPDQAALDTLLGVVARLLIGALGDPKTLQANLLAGLIHHRKHMRQTLISLANQITDGSLILTKIHRTRGTRVNAQFVFDRSAAHVVQFAERSVGVHKVFGRQKQRDASGSFGRIGKTGENEMDNILRHIVVAPRDKNLLTRNAVMVIFQDRFAAHRRQIRTRLGPGQVHRPGPFSSDQFF